MTSRMRTSRSAVLWYYRHHRTTGRTTLIGKITSGPASEIGREIAIDLDRGTRDMLRRALRYHDDLEEG